MAFPSSYLTILVPFLNLSTSREPCSSHSPPHCRTSQHHYLPFYLKSTPAKFLHHCSIKNALLWVTNDHYNSAQTLVTCQSCFVCSISSMWHGQLLLETPVLLDTTLSYFFSLWPVLPTPPCCFLLIFLTSTNVAGPASNTWPTVRLCAH